MQEGVSMRERGSGNLPFIAVLVLLVLVLALWFMAKDEADNLKAQRDRARQDAAQADMVTEKVLRTFIE